LFRGGKRGKRTGPDALPSWDGAFLLGNVPALPRNGLIPDRNAVKQRGFATAPARNALRQSRNATFPDRNGAALSGNGTAPDRNGAFPYSAGVFLDRKAAKQNSGAPFLSSGGTFLPGVTAFRSRNAASRDTSTPFRDEILREPGSTRTVLIFPAAARFVKYPNEYGRRAGGSGANR
jgi:hypothetical protein